ncbi:MFS transporter [Cellulomonas fengjieae]|uniref:MFS transporter n=1 Tax=Cellulomonas fengjieae TaxID=2819978 RepID=UPI001AAE599F|nr:MFS transporter [Cellulomonas fengjieae]MBO3103890.1 MFS transporter [Cellulomonas fengjieae]
MRWHPSRSRSSILAASLVGGSGEILDFLVPLWVGVELGATPAQIGALVAVEMLCSFVARPLAGWLTDTRQRTQVAAVGAALFGLSCLGYALAHSLPAAFLAAVAGGVGGALLWVAVRAVTAERLADDGAAFADLFASVSFASWFFWVPSLVLLPTLGYRGVFGALAATCLVAAAGLMLAPRLAVPTSEAPTPTSDLRRLAPLLAVVALTALAEAGVGLLLLLHLQRAFDLEVHQIALVYLPGGIAMTVLPRYLHGVTGRVGRRTVYAVASLASAVFAAGLALAPSPPAIAALWVLAGAAWAAITPIHEAAVVQASPTRTGRGMSLLGNAALGGGAVGSALAGALYGTASWVLVCAVFAALIAVGAVAGPRALRALGISDRPSAPVDAPIAPAAGPDL